MSTFRSWTGLFSAIFCLGGCSSDRFPKVEKLDRFRVLAVVASASEVAAGGSATAQLYISDTAGGGRTLTGTFETCVDPGIAFGAEVNCTHDPTKTSGSYTVNTSADPDLGAANLYTGLANQSVTVPVSAAIFTGRSAAQRINGVGVVVIFRLAVDGREVVAFRRIVATERTPLNADPVPSAILLNGTTMAARPARNDVLTIAADTPQTYTFINVDGTSENRVERYTVAWYVAKGELDRPKVNLGDAAKYEADRPDSTEVVVAVVRDDRGGLTVQRSGF